MIGIIGYGMVGKAVQFGFNRTHSFISDPSFNSSSIEELCFMGLDAIFVCVPTPTDDSNYAILKEVLTRIKNTPYQGLVVVKSTVLPGHLDGFDVIYNPEFLSRATSNQDFIKPPFVLIGGNRAGELIELYREKSQVDISKVYVTDIKTASLAKYVMNSFYATKVTFMNGMYDVANELGVDWNSIKSILKEQPWMGTHHFDVPGPDGTRGFGGPCLPKDTEALAKAFDLPILDKVLELNTQYRNKDTHNGN